MLFSSVFGFHCFHFLILEKQRAVLSYPVSRNLGDAWSTVTQHYRSLPYYFRNTAGKGKNIREKEKIKALGLDIGTTYIFTLFILSKKFESTRGLDQHLMDTYTSSYIFKYLPLLACSLKLIVILYKL